MFSVGSFYSIQYILGQKSAKYGRSKKVENFLKKGVDNGDGVCYYNRALRRAATERHERVAQRGA